jgi:hypothetical protein
VAGLSAKRVSLALFIGLMSSLKRRDEVVVPSLPALLMNTAVPPEEIWFQMLPI